MSSTSTAVRVVTTAPKTGFEQYGARWLSGLDHWPNAEFYWYTEGYEVAQVTQRPINDLTDFAQWKLKHARYVSPSWKYDFVAYAHKVFAFIDATKDYKGIAVWLDADCITYRDIPEGLIESKVKDAYIAHYERPGRWTETGMFIVDCGHPEHHAFWDFIRDVYLNDRFKGLHHWTDCYILDAAIKRFKDAGKIKTVSLSEDKSDAGHPMAVTEFGRYIDHTKGEDRKALGRSLENKFRTEYEAV